MSLFCYVLSTIVIDGYKNLNSSEVVPTLEIMKENFPEVEGFIVPFTTISEVL
jgi:hypothetical protein